MGFHRMIKDHKSSGQKLIQLFLFSYLTKSSIGFILCAVGNENTQFSIRKLDFALRCKEDLC